MKKIIREWREHMRVEPLGVAMPGVRLPERVKRIFEGGATVRISRRRVACLIAICAAVCVPLLVGVLAHAQAGGGQVASGAALPEFEVASVKPTPPDNHEMGTFLTYPGGRIEARGCTLTYLIMLAYNVQAFQISGGDEWVGKDRFSISAKPPADSASTKINPSNPKLPPPDEERLMLRAMLGNRFQLTVKQTTQDASGFALVLKNGNPNLNEPKDKEAYPVVVGGPTGDPQNPWYFQGINASMTKLADRLSGILSVPIVDQTGVQGNFDFVIKYANSTDVDASAPLLKNAVEEIGLRLEPTKVPTIHLEIEHAAQPSGN